MCSISKIYEIGVANREDRDLKTTGTNINEM